MTWTLPQLLEHVEKWAEETLRASKTDRMESHSYNQGASDSYTVVAHHLKQMINGDGDAGQN